MAAKKRARRPGRDRRQRFQAPPPPENSEYMKRVELSVVAAQIIESMIDDPLAAVRCVQREFQDVFEVVYAHKEGSRRSHVYLKAYDRRRKHAHIVIKLGAFGMPNKIVSTTCYGRAFALP